MRGGNGARGSRFGLRTKIIGLLWGVLLVFAVAIVAYSYQDQRSRVDNAMLDQSRMLAAQMDAVWEFVSINQYAINHTADGTYDFKRLHCAIAGKAVAMMFTKSSDYSIRFTNIDPRNIYNAPDEYELAALTALYDDPDRREVYGYGTDDDGEQVFRYVRTMVYDESCLQCHGTPEGEIDETGYPKEGKGVGDLAGAVSIVIPMQGYLENMNRAVASSAALFVLLMLGVAAVIYGVLSRLVTRPLRYLRSSFGRIGDGARIADGERIADRARIADGARIADRARIADGAREGEADGEADGGPLRPPAMPEAAPFRAGRYSTREVSDLFDQYESMARRLWDLYENLESQVVDRTARLSEANAELERQRARVEEANAKLLRDNRYKSDFLAIVSHELRTPLTSILAFAELLSQSVDPSETVVLKQVEEVGRNAAVLLEMVDNVLETARIQAGSERINLELIDLGDIVGMVEAANEPVALKRGVAFGTRVEPDVPLVTSDWEKVRRILTNLVSNAIKFTPAGGEVDVRVSLAATGTGDEAAGERGGGTGDEAASGAAAWAGGGTGGGPRGLVRIDVSDTGIGIPKEKQGLVFERFTQENMSTVRRYGGSGLGLSLVKDLAAMLGGRVELQSEPGRGSVFTVFLPLDDAEGVSNAGYWDDEGAEGAEEAEKDEKAQGVGDASGEGPRPVER